MKKQISALIAIAALATLAACGSTPTASTATPGTWQANSAPADTTGRIPNMMGSGN